MGRARLRLVPKGGVEMFEIRIAYYLDEQGDRMVRAVCSTPEDKECHPELQELLGVIEVAKLQWWQQSVRQEEE